MARGSRDVVGAEALTLESFSVIQSAASGEVVSGLADRGPAACVEAVVRVHDRDLLRTRAVPGLAARALSDYPGLKRHRCECGSARGIEAELADTETAHLLEHLALELMVGRGAPRSLRGETRWDFVRDGRGVFRVSVGCDPAAGATPDMAEECLREGTEIVNLWIAEMLAG